uniref:Uncharacterized protein n=1 Tax=Arundo donax TaxID=35708 RepID=A0A0A9BQQ0_ARUDO
MFRSTWLHHTIYFNKTTVQPATMYPQPSFKGYPGS